MKECVFCETVLEDSVGKCSNCGQSRFMNSTRVFVPKHPAVDAVDPEQLLEDALRAAEVDLSDRQVRSIKRAVIRLCKMKKTELNERVVDGVIQELERWKRKYA